MTKTEIILNILRNLFLNPKNIRRCVDESDFYQRYLLRKYSISHLPTLEINDLFPNFNVEIENYAYLEGSSLTIDIAFLKMLALQYPACHYFELGCWRGESLYNVASVSEKCTALTLSDAEMRTMGIAEEIISQNHFFTKNLKNITFINHNSLDFDFNRITEPFDLLFIDGDHHYNSIVSDTKNVLSLRRNNQSIIVWHDYGFNPEMVRPEVLAGILDGIPPELHKYLVHISNTKCAALILKEFDNTKIQKYPTTPNKSFKVRIEATSVDFS